MTGATHFIEEPENLHDDTGEYPSEETLEFIRNFDCAKNRCLYLAKFIEKIWWAADWGYTMKGKKLYLSTGGWSGNEEIIDALQSNHVFWLMCWYETKRGGHYTFIIKEVL